MKKTLFLVVVLMLCLAFTACGGDESGGAGDESGNSAEMLTIGDISFQQSEDYPLEVEEGNLDANYVGDEDWTTGIGVYAHTDEVAASYDDYYGSNPQNAEELYDCFLNKNPNIATKEKIEIDGVEAYAVTYNMESGGDETDIIFFYNDCVYSIVVWSDNGPIDKGMQEAFDTIVDTVTLN